MKDVLIQLRIAAKIKVGLQLERKESWPNALQLSEGKRSNIYRAISCQMNSVSDGRCLFVDVSYIIRPLKSFFLSRVGRKTRLGHISILKKVPIKNRFHDKHEALKPETSLVKTQQRIYHTPDARLETRGGSGQCFYGVFFGLERGSSGTLVVRTFEGALFRAQTADRYWPSPSSGANIGFNQKWYHHDYSVDVIGSDHLIHNASNAHLHDLMDERK